MKAFYVLHNLNTRVLKIGAHGEMLVSKYHHFLLTLNKLFYVKLRFLFSLKIEKRVIFFINVLLTPTISFKMYVLHYYFLSKNFMYEFTFFLFTESLI